jgi:hypothetical protein
LKIDIGRSLIGKSSGSLKDLGVSFLFVDLICPFIEDIASKVSRGKCVMAFSVMAQLRLSAGQESAQHTKNRLLSN